MELELPEEARALLDAVVAIGSDLDLRGVLRRMVESACILTHADYGVLATVDDDGAFIDLVAHGVSEDTLEHIGRQPAGRGVLALVPRTGEAMRVEHVATHPVFEGLPDGHPPIDRFLGVPVLAGDRVFGHLYLGNGPAGRTFTATDQALVEALGRAAAVMIDNARAFEESERHRAWMAGVARFTTALSPSFHDGESLTALVEQVRQLARARAVALVDVASDRLEITARAGTDAEDLDLTVKQATEEIRRAAVDGHLVEVGPDPGPGPGSATLVVPAHTDLAGPAVLLIDGSAAWGSLDHVERSLVVALGDHVGLALDRDHALRERHELLLAKDRDRIARDLHDLVIQRLFATGMQLQGVRDLTAAQEVHERVGSAIKELDVAINDLRATIFELGQGAGRSVHEEARALVEYYESVLGFRPTLRVSGQVDRSLTPDAGNALLLALREALSNMARHARATSGSVELSASPEWVRMRVTDDGVGFDPARTTRRSGLDNARHRAEALGGHFALDSADGAGCRLEWVVPAVS